LHCETRLGLVFVNPFAGAVPTLDQWLGKDILETLATPLAHGSYVVAKKRSSVLPVNWKIWAENARDGYHVPFVHPFFRKASPPGPFRIAENGHAIQELGMSREGMDQDLWDKLHHDMLPGLGDNDGYIVTLFPDATIMVRSNFVSIDVQHVSGVKELQFEERLLALSEDSEETRERRLLGQDTWFWNPLDLEDSPIFISQQKGVESRGVSRSLIARGVDAETGTRGDDNRLRHFWKQWRSMMNTDTNG
jgi:phenylpropionate dioxygenase-like ring-hydroxylating dioxygenase large terminal subunit